MAEAGTTGAWPSGSVALVFTDVEGSTELWMADEDAFSWALMEHDAEVRESLAKHYGVEVKHTGDGFFLCFREASVAARFAVDLQARLARHVWPPELGPIRSRIGIHYGVARLHGRDYRGAAVSFASRICEAARGGQILLSADTAAMIQDDAEVGCRLRSIGEIPLHGLGPTPLYELACEVAQPIGRVGHTNGGREPQRHSHSNGHSSTAGSTSNPGSNPGSEFGREFSSEFGPADRAGWEEARAALKQGDAGRAIDLLRELHERHPLEPRLLNSLGVAHAWLRDYERAEAYFHQAVSLEPDSAAAWFNLARVYGKLGRRQQITEALTNALRADPYHAKARAVAEKYGIRLDDETTAVDSDHA